LTSDCCDTTAGTRQWEFVAHWQTHWPVNESVDITAMPLFLLMYHPRSGGYKSLNVDITAMPLFLLMYRPRSGGYKSLNVDITAMPLFRMMYHPRSGGYKGLNEE